MQLQWSRWVQPLATSGNTTKGSEEAVKFSDEMRPAKMQKVSPGGCWWHMAERRSCWARASTVIGKPSFYKLGWTLSVHFEVLISKSSLVGVVGLVQTSNWSVVKLWCFVVMRSWPHPGLLRAGAYLDLNLLRCSTQKWRKLCFRTVSNFIWHS